MGKKNPIFQSLSFIGRIICHIPDKSFPMIRYYGLFSNKGKKEYLGKANKVLGIKKNNNILNNEKNKKWEKRQESYLGHNPLICKECNIHMELEYVMFGKWDRIENLFMKYDIPPEYWILLFKTRIVKIKAQLIKIKSYFYNYV